MGILRQFTVYPSLKMLVVHADPVAIYDRSGEDLFYCPVGVVFVGMRSRVLSCRLDQIGKSTVAVAPSHV